LPGTVVVLMKPTVNGLKGVGSVVQVFSAEALLDRVWTSDSEASPETIRTYIKRLRKKIDDEGKQSMLNTVHGVGYKLVEPE